MREKEIHDKRWVVASPLIVRESLASSIDAEEQELHINVMKRGMRNESEEEAVITSSYGRYITRLSMSEYFLLTEVVVSKRNRQILQVTGFMHPKGVGLRKKAPDKIKSLLAQSALTTNLQYKND
jgi:hypothetical protein